MGGGRRARGACPLLVIGFLDLLLVGRCGGDDGVVADGGVWVLGYAGACGGGMDGRMSVRV